MGGLSGQWGSVHREELCLCGTTSAPDAISRAMWINHAIPLSRPSFVAISQTPSCSGPESRPTEIIAS